MTVLLLKCRSLSIGIDLPAAPAEVAVRLSKLRKGTAASVRIIGTHSPIPNLIPYLRHTDLDNETNLQKLNTLL